MGYNPKTYNLLNDREAYYFLEEAVFHVLDRHEEKLFIPTETYGEASNLLLRLTKWIYSFRAQNIDEARTNPELLTQIGKYLSIKPRILPKRNGKFGVELLNYDKIPNRKFEIIPGAHTIVPTTKTEPTPTPTDEPLTIPTKENT